MKKFRTLKNDNGNLLLSKNILLLLTFLLFVISNNALANPKHSDKGSERAALRSRGFVTSSSCPFTCEKAGVPKEFCKMSRRGNSCSVEDLRKAPGHQSVVRFFSAKRQAENTKRSSRGIDGTWITLTNKELASKQGAPVFKNGMVTSARCPYNCEIAGISKKYCREKKRGDICQVEDLRQPPGHQSLIDIGRYKRNNKNNINLNPR